MLFAWQSRESFPDDEIYLETRGLILSAAHDGPGGLARLAAMGNEPVAVLAADLMRYKRDLARGRYDKRPIPKRLL